MRKKKKLILITFFIIISISSYIFYLSRYSMSTTSITLLGTKERKKDVIKNIIHDEFDLTVIHRKDYPIFLKYSGFYRFNISSTNSSLDIINSKKETLQRAKILLELIDKKEGRTLITWVNEPSHNEINIYNFIIQKKYTNRQLILRVWVLEEDEIFKKYNVKTKITFRATMYM